MKSNIEIKEKSMVSITVDANASKWADTQKTVFERLAAELEVPGFEKGEAPLEKVQELVTETDVIQNAAGELLEELYRFAVATHDITPATHPYVEVITLSPEELQVVFHIAVKPEFEVAEYKGLTTTKDEAKVEDFEIELALKQVLDAHVKFNVVDRAVENGDTVVIDFEGIKDGVAFEGGSAENFSLEIGSQQFIPGFEDQIIGRKANEEFEINVTFPEDYGQSDLDGAPVVFKIKLHEVRVADIPVLSDDFVKTLKIEGVNTVEDYREFVAKSILEQKLEEVEARYVEALINIVVENTEVELPEPMVNNEVENMYQQLIQRFQQQGLNEEMFLQMTNQTVEAIKEEMKLDAIRKIKFTLVLEKIVENEDITVSLEEIDAEFAKIATMYQMELEDVKSMVPDTSGIEYEIKMQKATDVIKDNAR